MDSFLSVILFASDTVLLLKQVIVLSLVHAAYNGAENNYFILNPTFNNILSDN